MKSTFLLSFACLISFVTALASAATAAEKPKEILEATQKIRKAGTDAAKAEGRAGAGPKTQEEIIARALKGLEGIDPATVDLTEVKLWLQVYAQARDYAGARTLARRWASEATGKDKFDAQVTLIREEARGTNFTEVRKGLLSARPVDAAQGLQLAGLVNTYLLNVVKNEGREEGLKVLAAGEKALPKEGLTDMQASQAKRSEENLAKARKTIEQNPGKEAEALQKERMAALPSLLGRGTNASAAAAASRAERDAKLAKMVGTMGTDFKAGQTIGQFQSVAGLKGKVVLLDFFAHWCGPCIASFPSVRELYDDLKPKGLEVVGVTKYYGYYKTENRASRDMTREKELDRMKEFVTEKKMNWPVAFVDSTVFADYQCSAIPHVVLLDREGKIHKIKVGFSAAEFPKFRAEVEKLLKE